MCIIITATLRPHSTFLLVPQRTTKAGFPTSLPRLRRWTRRTATGTHGHLAPRYSLLAPRSMVHPRRPSAAAGSHPSRPVYPERQEDYRKVNILRTQHLQQRQRPANSGPLPLSDTTKSYCYFLFISG